MYLLRLFSSVNVDDLVLIHIFKDVWGIHQDANSANRCDKEEHVELQSIDYHSHKLPVFSYLKKQKQKTVMDFQARDTKVVRFWPKEFCGYGGRLIETLRVVTRKNT